MMNLRPHSTTLAMFWFLSFLATTSDAFPSLQQQPHQPRFKYLKRKRPQQQQQQQQYLFLSSGSSADEKGKTATTPTASTSDVVVVVKKVGGGDEADICVDDIFCLIAGRAGLLLLESDIRRDAVGSDPGIVASGATNWINDASAFALQQAMNRLRIKLPDERTGVDRDEASAWMRWMKTVPSPLIVDFSTVFREKVDEIFSDKAYQVIDQSKQDFMNRIGCRIILLPSGASLSRPLSEYSASIIYGKLLYGGVIRSRLLASSNSKAPPRQAGVRQEIKISPKQNIPVWIMYGGPNRMYQGVDIGPAAVMEVVLLPRGKSLASSLDGHMVINEFGWKPQQIFDFVPDKEQDSTADSANGDANADYSSGGDINGYSPSSLSGRDRNEAFRSRFQSSVGGLQPQIDAIVRRVLDGRIIRPADLDETMNGKSSQQESGDKTSRELSATALEAEELARIGLTPVRGLLLYGPPGCGKTALAREISKALRARAPKIVSAPELLDRWVGGSEKLVRALFADAEAELAACNGDASRSALHVVVIDEIDAVFRKRTSAEDSGESTRSSVVNQILAKLDGVNSIPNVLLIGMTNRRELLDEALLRPGRLEVQIEIPKPDREGRREILQIHFRALREKDRLSKPLCSAIDGVSSSSSTRSLRDGRDKNQPWSTTSPSFSAARVTTLPSETGKRAAMKRSLRKLVQSFRSMSGSGYDLAADYATGGFTGADIAGLVRCAGSIALERSRQNGGGLEGLLITLEDVMLALDEVKHIS